jgi:hypothetical protein
MRNIIKSKIFITGQSNPVFSEARGRVFESRRALPIAGNKLTLPGARLRKYLLSIPEN